MVNIPVNKYQTEITEELLETLPKEVQDELIDIINTVPYVRSLISPNRQYAKDRPRDKKGRIIVDLINPHILEDMDYFRPIALHFKEHGTLTNLRPNANPNSEYGKWLREEKRRIWDGMVRPEDGEWVTGYLYWYLNYAPILLNKIRKGTKVADRVEDMPECWEGVYLRFHYIDQARNGGIYNNFLGGNHGSELASRGKAFAYSQEIETPEGRKKWRDIKIGDYLFAPDGSLTRVIDIPFDELHDVYKMELIDGRIIYTTLEHLWKINKNGKNWNKLYTTEEILNSNQIHRFAIEKNNGVEYYKTKVPIDAYFLGLILGDGSMTISTKNRAQFSSREEDVEIYKKETNLNFNQVNNSPQNWLVEYEGIKDRLEVLGLNDKVSYNKFIPNCYKYNSKEIRLELLKGLLDTDGSVHDSGKPEFYTTSKQLAEDVMWIARSLGYNTSMWEKSPKYKYKGETLVGKICYVVYIYTNDILFKLPRKIKLCGKRSKKLDSRVNKTSIKSITYSHKEMCKCVTVDRKDGLFLIGDFITTHNSKSYSMASILAHNFVLGENNVSYKDTTSIVTAYQKEYLTKEGVLNKFLSIADFCSKYTQFPRKRIKNSIQEMVWRMGYIDVATGIEKGSKNQVIGVSSKDDESKLRGKRAVFIGIEEFGTFPRLVDLYNVLIPSVQEGDIIFGFMYLQGTAGDNESDFAGAQEIMYNPKGYNMYALKNVYDKQGQGKPDFVFFFPGYMNRKGCYDKNGVSDVVAALIEILMNRHRVKYNSSDPNTIVKTKAEVPITPSEAIVKTTANMFPVVDLTERLGQLDNNPREYDDVFVGDLTMDKGTVTFKPTGAIPIRDYPLKDNKAEGAIEILKMPELDRNNKPFAGRYILSCDPYDDDSADTMSLGSIYVLDLWTDTHVAYYTGRPMFADDFYEMARRMCLFYNGRMNYENNKKGLFAYFSRMNSLYLLTDVLDFLKDKDMVKGQMYGNKAKGTIATAPVNAYGRMLLRNWLLKPTIIIEEIDGEPVETTVPNLYKLRDRALIKELINFNDSGNFDRISSHIMLMLLREERLITYQGNLQGSKEEIDADYLGNDKFFKDNYKERLPYFMEQ